MNLRFPFLVLALSLTAGTVAAQSPNVQAGASVYEINCMGCHAATPGNIGTMVLAKRLGKEMSVLTDRKHVPAEFTKAIVRQGLGIMPGFRPTEISDAELEQLAAFLAKEY